MSHFSKSTLRKLARKGITLVGITYLPGDGRPALRDRRDGLLPERQRHPPGADLPRGAGVSRVTPAPLMQPTPVPSPGEDAEDGVDRNDRGETR
jgi:hypothetical protein